MPPDPPIERSGFTLVEMVLSLLLLTAFLVSVWGLSSTVTGIGNYSQGLTLATALAQEKADELISVPIATAASGNDTVGRFGRRWTVSAGAAAGIRDIDVEVMWQGIAARTNRFRIKTMRN